MSIGARSQSAKTYLERHFKSFENGKLFFQSCFMYMQTALSDQSSHLATLNELVKHGLLALRETLQQDKELNTSNVSLGIVGEDETFNLIEDEALKQYLDMVEDLSARSSTRT